MGESSIGSSNGQTREMNNFLGTARVFCHTRLSSFIGKDYEERDDV